MFMPCYCRLAFKNLQHIKDEQFPNWWLSLFLVWRVIDDLPFFHLLWDFRVYHVQVEAFRTQTEGPNLTSPNSTNPPCSKRVDFFGPDLEIQIFWRSFHIFPPYSHHFHQQKSTSTVVSGILMFQSSSSYWSVQITSDITRFLCHDHGICFRFCQLVAGSCWIP